MKAYLITTGTLFGLLALVHLVLTIMEWGRLAESPGRIIQGPGIGSLAAAICFWAWRLLRHPTIAGITEGPAVS
jgi:hypothetical protein